MRFSMSIHLFQKSLSPSVDLAAHEIQGWGKQGPEEQEGEQREEGETETVDQAILKIEVANLKAELEAKNNEVAWGRVQAANLARQLLQKAGWKDDRVDAPR